MLTLDTVARIRREYFVKQRSIGQIVRELRVSRNTVRKVIRSGETEFTYAHEVQPRPALARCQAELGQAELDQLLVTNAARPARERVNLMRIHEQLTKPDDTGLGYTGSYSALRRYAQSTQAWGTGSQSRRRDIGRLCAIECCAGRSLSV